MSESAMRITRRSTWPSILIVLGVGVLARAAEEPEVGDESGQAKEKRESAEGRLWLGLEGFPADETLRVQLELPEGQGFIVDKVHSESPAERAGLRRHDIILRAGGQEVEAVAKLADLVQGSGGEPVKLEILRAGKKLDLTATPGKRAERADEGPQTTGGRIHWQPYQDFFGQQQPFFQGGDSFTFRSLNGLALLSPRQVPDVPDDVTVTVTKRGKEPASIEVRRGKERWKATDGEIDTLPPEMAKHAKSVLGTRSWSHHSWYDPANPMGFSQPKPEPGIAELRGEIDRLDRGLKELRELFRKLEEGKDREDARR